ncbi:N(1)-aminopropylagmatine ureohydrolase [BD1-7 clade bacterium]|uniref:N(1)-aminopropylagmatine ureohydrolase n=1 Tax=BD1-7 clade bacterium TaxID=2029982 RepID=A0A5S9R023_9GAMM|nr:N(1)-aminopropylagmatine ureohydrolase [BD1-7 clade bacterium]
MSDAIPTDEFPIFLGSEIEQAAAEKAAFHVLPVPYENTVSYGGGTRYGPSSILKASWQLEQWDGKSKPCAQGIHTCEPVDCQQSPGEVIEAIAEATQKIVEAGAMPVVLGGEHTVTLGVVKGLINAGITDFGLVQVDAHADLRDAFEGDPLSHASVMRRIVNLDIPLLQLGIRAFCEEEIEARDRYGVRYLDADDLVPQRIQQIEIPEDFPKKVFFTLDIDGMDPSVFPSTGTPVPGGLDWYQTLNLFESVASQREIIGFDIMEFAPIEGFHAYDFAASLLTYKLMGLVERSETAKA